MIKQICVCDKCGKEIAGDKISIFDYDFCGKCSTAVKAAVASLLAKEGITVEAKQDPAESAQKTKRAKVIDWDKACALKLAGWTNKQIAEEVGATHGTIDVMIAKKLDAYTEKRGIENA